MLLTHISMKKIIIAIIVLVVLGAAVFILTRKTSDWQTYSNTRYEFRIDYPADWSLGDPETNNAGRELYSPDREASCYAYGFANVLQNEQGNPQSLDEFIDWLVADTRVGEGLYTVVIERKAATLSGRDAIYLLFERDMDIQESIYVLGDETGIGFFCGYNDMEDRDKYRTTFNRMAESIQIDIFLDGDAAKNLAVCSDLVAGVFVPLKDLQMFVDDKYTEVTLTSYDAWDRNRLPTQVIELESKGYDCFPMPLEFDGGEAEGDVLPEPTVTLVEWSCELEYDEWEYIQGLEAMQPPDRLKDYSCEKEDCFAEDGSDSYAWLCTK